MDDQMDYEKLWKEFESELWEEYTSDLTGSKSLNSLISRMETLKSDQRNNLAPKTIKRDDFRLKLSVNDLGMGMRARKCFKRLNIVKVADLIVLDADDLLKVNNFGITCLVKVRENLKQIGLCLGMTIGSRGPR